MLSPPRTRGVESGRYSIQRLQLPDRDNTSALASRHENRRGADCFYRSFPRPLQDVRSYRARSIVHGLALVFPKQYAAETETARTRRYREPEEERIVAGRAK